MADQDPLAMIEQLYGSQPWGTAGGGAGSGFADKDYWLAHPSEILNGRLGADLAGSGPDQPTGTPGSGVWGSSGKNAAPGLVPSGQPAGSFPMPTPGGDNTQSNLVQQALLGLMGPGATGTPNAPMTTPPSANDQTLGNYSDLVRQQVLKQME